MVNSLFTKSLIGNTITIFCVQAWRMKKILILPDVVIALLLIPFLVDSSVDHNVHSYATVHDNHDNCWCVYVVSAPLQLYYLHNPIRRVVFQFLECHIH